MLDLINGIFCSTCLIQKAYVRRRMRKALRKHLAANMKVVYRAADPASMKYNQALINLLNHTTDPTLQFEDPHKFNQRAKRCLAQRKLLEFSQAFGFNGGLCTSASLDVLAGGRLQRWFSLKHSSGTLPFLRTHKYRH